MKLKKSAIIHGNIKKLITSLQINLYFTSIIDKLFKTSTYLKLFDSCERFQCIVLALFDSGIVLRF